MKTKNLFKKGYSYAEMALVVSTIGVLAGTAIGISSISVNTQNELDNAKVNLTNSKIAQVYMDTTQNASHAEVKQLLSSKDNFIYGYSQYFDENPTQSQITVTNFKGEEETVDALTFDNGVSIGFEYVRDNCSNNNGAPCGALHVTSGNRSNSDTSDFFVYEDQLVSQLPYNPQYQTYNESTNSFVCDKAKGTTYLAQQSNPKLYFANNESCFASCEGAKVADTTTYDRCTCPPRQPADMNIPEFGYYDPEASECISCYGNKVYENGKCTCGTLKEECNGVFDDEFCECTSCEYNLSPNSSKNDCICTLPNVQGGWVLKDEYRYTASKADKICENGDCQFCVEKCPKNKLHDKQDLTKCTCPDTPVPGLKFDNKHQYYDKNSANCISTCSVSVRIRNENNVTECICPPEEDLIAIGYFQNGEEYDPTAANCKTAACPVVFSFNGKDVHGVRTNGVCGCPAEREFQQGGKYYGYIDKDTEVYDKNATGCKRKDTNCTEPSKAYNHKCVCMTEAEINAWNPNYIGAEEEYFNDNGDRCKRNKCKVRFTFNGKDVRGVRNEQDQSCNCPAEIEFLQGGKYYGYINKDTEVYDSSQPNCKRVTTSCEEPTKAVNQNCVCMTEAEINAWNPRYLNPLIWEYYDDGGIECRREVCPILFEYNEEQVRYRNPNTGICECPPESQFLQGGKYYGYINKDTEVYDFSQPNCKRVTTSCEKPTKAVNQDCVCMTEAEINAWNPNYIGNEEEYYDDGGLLCKRDKCSVRFTFNGKDIRGVRNEQDQSCNCPAENEFKAGGKYAGYINFETEKYDPLAQTCKSLDCKGRWIIEDEEGCICNPVTPDKSEFTDVNIHQYYDPNSTSGDCLSQCSIEYKVRDKEDMTACVCPDTKPTCKNEADPYCFDNLLKDNEIFDKTKEDKCINSCITGSGCVGEACFSARYPITKPNTQKTDCVCVGTLFPRQLNKNYTLDELRDKSNLEICVCPDEATLRRLYPNYIDPDTEVYDATSLNCKKTAVECNEDFQIARNGQCVCKDEADIKAGYINPETEEYYPQDTQTCKRAKCDIMFYYKNMPVRGERIDGICGCPSQQKFEEGGQYYGYINEDFEEYDSSDPSCKKSVVSCENFQIAKNKQCICKDEDEMPQGYIGEEEEYYPNNTQTCKRTKCAVRFEFNGQQVRGIRNEADQSCNCPEEKEFKENGKYFGYIGRNEVYTPDVLSCKVSQCPLYGNLFVVMNFENTTEDGVTLEFNIKSFSNDRTLNAITYYGSIHNANTENDQAWQTLLSKMSTADKNRTFEKYSAYLIAETGEVIGVFTPESAKAILNQADHYNCNDVCKINGTPDEDCVKTCTEVNVMQSILNTSYNNSYYYNENIKEEFYGGEILIDGECAYKVKDTIFRKTSPLVLDLKGDGLEFTSVFSGVNFDLNADGKAELTAWTTVQTEFDNAFLVYDKNNNGQVDNGAELFGDQNGADNGFNELAKYDDNNDGIIDQFDGIYDELTLWVDYNKNGTVDYQNGTTKELKSLKDANITEISTTFTTQTDENGNIATDNNGNTTGIVGFFKMLIEGTKEVIRSIIDVFFVNA